MDFFHYERGLRQGDLISPYLFIIMAEKLGRSIGNWRRGGKIHGFTNNNSSIISTHIQFVDDTLIIGKAYVVEAKNYMKILQLYEVASQQKVNFDKSKTFFIHTLVNRKRKVANIF